MTDRITKIARSRIMRSIRSSGTLIEIEVRRYFHSRGLRFRLYRKDLPGRPDIVLPKYKFVIFVNGCFWHAHKSRSCTIWRMPKSNNEYWSAKFMKNKLRDLRSRRNLRTLGWKTITIWECALTNKSTKYEFLECLIQRIRGNSPTVRVPLK